MLDMLDGLMRMMSGAMNGAVTQSAGARIANVVLLDRRDKQAADESLPQLVASTATQQGHVAEVAAGDSYSLLLRKDGEVSTLFNTSY